MTDKETTAIKQFVANKEQFEAVKKLLLDHFQPQSWSQSIALGTRNEEYGERMKLGRVCYETIENYFDFMQEIAQPKKDKAKNSTR